LTPSRLPADAAAMPAARELPSDADRFVIDRAVSETANRAVERGAKYAAVLGLGAGVLVLLLMLLRLLSGVAVPALFGFVAGGYSMLLHRVARRRRLRGALLYWLLLPFVSLPTLFFLAAHALMPFGAATFITGPFSYLYLVVIVVTGFFFEERLPRLAGVVCAVEYLGCYWLAAPKLALISTPDLAALQDLTAAPIYALKTVMMLAGGFVTGALASTARGLVVRALHEERERQGLSRLFGQFVSPEVKDRIIRDKLGTVGERRQVAVLFADIRNFTSRAEQADPVALVGQLNEYFDSMVTAITRHGGVVDKLVGDAVMAVFGGVLELPSPATAALEAAVEMRQQLGELNQRLVERGVAPFENGVGIHFGEVVQGTIGSAERKDFTVIGDVVNTAARVEGLTKDKGYPILVTRAVRDLLPSDRQPACVSLGPVRLKGKQREVEIFGLR
jgi:adenylate cyclase